MFKNTFLMLLAALALNAAPAAWGQAWPTRPVRIVVGFPPGGMADTLPRRLQDALGTALGQPVVIDNKPGGAGVVGVLAITQARDDHTIGVLTLQNLTYQAIEAKVPYDLRKDVQGVSVIATVPYVLGINAASPIKTTGEFLSYAKANPGKLKMGTPGVATGSQFVLELMKNGGGGLDIVHVPYKGMIMAYNDVVGGHVDASVGPLGSMRQFIEAGKIRALGIATATRHPKMPNLPTLLESTGNRDLVFGDWYVIVAPTSMPEANLQKLSKAIHDIMATKAFTDSAQAGGLDLMPTSPKETKSFLVKELDRVTEVLQRTGIKLE
jgi:tripartite-type tricarboxylate transporter receptor subunit TctC